MSPQDACHADDDSASGGHANNQQDQNIEKSSDGVIEVINTEQSLPANLPMFLTKTYEFVSDPGYDDIVSWNQDGTGFIVRDVNKFCDRILPKYFKHSNFASFVRQLNMYDFKKSRTVTNDQCFTQQFFQRGRKELLAQIKRKCTPAEKNQQLLRKQVEELQNQQSMQQVNEFQRKRYQKSIRKSKAQDRHDQLKGPLMITQGANEDMYQFTQLAQLPAPPQQPLNENNRWLMNRQLRGQEESISDENIDDDLPLEAQFIEPTGDRTGAVSRPFQQIVQMHSKKIEQLEQRVGKLEADCQRLYEENYELLRKNREMSKGRDTQKMLERFLLLFISSMNKGANGLPSSFNPQLTIMPTYQNEARSSRYNDQRQSSGYQNNQSSTSYPRNQYELSQREPPQIQEIAASNSQYNVDGVSRHAKSQVGAGIVNDSNMQGEEQYSERIPNHRSAMVSNKKPEAHERKQTTATAIRKQEIDPKHLLSQSLDESRRSRSRRSKSEPRLNESLSFEVDTSKKQDNDANFIEDFTRQNNKMFKNKPIKLSKIRSESDYSQPAGLHKQHSTALLAASNHLPSPFNPSQGHMNNQFKDFFQMMMDYFNKSQQPQRDDPLTQQQARAAHQSLQYPVSPSAQSIGLANNQNDALKNWYIDQMQNFLASSKGNQRYLTIDENQYYDPNRFKAYKETTEQQPPPVRQDNLSKNPEDRSLEEKLEQGPKISFDKQISIAPPLNAPPESLQPKDVRQSNVAMERKAHADQDMRDFDQMSEQRSINFENMSNKNEFTSVTELLHQQRQQQNDNKVVGNGEQVVQKQQINDFKFMQPEPLRSRYPRKKNIGQYSELSSIPPSPRVPMPILETPKQQYNNDKSTLKYNLNPYLNLDELPANAKDHHDQSLNYDHAASNQRISNDIWHKPEGSRQHLHPNMPSRNNSSSMNMSRANRESRESRYFQQQQRRQDQQENMNDYSYSSNFQEQPFDPQQVLAATEKTNSRYGHNQGQELGKASDRHTEVNLNMSNMAPMMQSSQAGNESDRKRMRKESMNLVLDMLNQESPNHKARHMDRFNGKEFEENNPQLNDSNMSLLLELQNQQRNKKRKDDEQDYRMMNEQQHRRDAGRVLNRSGNQGTWTRPQQQQQPQKSPAMPQVHRSSQFIEESRYRDMQDRAAYQKKVTSQVLPPRSDAMSVISGNSESFKQREKTRRLVRDFEREQQSLRKNQMMHHQAKRMRLEDRGGNFGVSGFNGQLYERRQQAAPPAQDRVYNNFQTPPTTNQGALIEQFQPFIKKFINLERNNGSGVQPSIGNESSSRQYTANHNVEFEELQSTHSNNTMARVNNNSAQVPQHMNKSDAREMKHGPTSAPPYMTLAADQINALNIRQQQSSRDAKGRKVSDPEIDMDQVQDEYDAQSNHMRPSPVPPLNPRYLERSQSILGNMPPSHAAAQHSHIAQQTSMYGLDDSIDMRIQQIRHQNAATASDFQQNSRDAQQADSSSRRHISSGYYESKSRQESNDKPQQRMNFQRPAARFERNNSSSSNRSREKVD